MKPIFSIESITTTMYTKLIKDELNDKNIFFSTLRTANGRESKARAQILNEIMSGGRMVRANGKRKKREERS